MGDLDHLDAAEIETALTTNAAAAVVKVSLVAVLVQTVWIIFASDAARCASGTRHTGCPCG